MGLFGNNNAQPQNGQALNLGASSNPFATQNGMMGQASQNPFMSGMAGSMGMNQQQMNQMGQQAMQPPSEAEIQMALMKSLAPTDRFIISQQMSTLLSMLNDLVSFSVLEILKGATFVINEDEGTMKLDVTSLPSNLQTMSAENVTGQFSAMQMTSQQNIQQAEMQQQQIMAFAQQSMMGGALSAAMANDGFMDKAGGAAGNFMGRMMGMR
tara:strand:- start:1480 stop:2112 length:633 start_codon:yes stop_codon:yes gene_type:complete